MPGARVQSVDDYLARQPAGARAILERVRATLRKALPGAEEVLSYQIPAYRVDGRIALYFAGWKEHYALYPAVGRVAEELSAKLAPYRVSKGTLRFPLGRPVPVRLIARIAKLRAEETAERAAARRGARTVRARRRTTAAPRARATSAARSSSR